MITKEAIEQKAIEDFELGAQMDHTKLTRGGFKNVWIGTFKAGASFMQAECDKRMDNYVSKLSASVESEIKMGAELQDALQEIDRLKRVITKELSENDDLGCEYTYVIALKEELKAMDALAISRAEEIELLGLKVDELYDHKNASEDRYNRDQETIADLKNALACAADFIDTMETINMHLGYKFTQPIIKVRQDLKSITQTNGGV